MASSTEICNLALSHLGVGKEISDLDTDQSSEGSLCRRFYETTRDAVLRDFPWPFATRILALGLVESDPNDEWDYSYRYPSDCLKLRRILSGQRQDTNGTRVAYKITRDDTGRLVYTDEENAEAEYTMLNDDPNQYPPDFILALSFRLAFYIAPALTGGDPYNLQQRMLNMYQSEISQASANSVNEEQMDIEPYSEFERSRA